MDLNLVVLCGRIAVLPEHRQFDSGASQLRVLLTVRTDAPNPRVELIPVIVWNPPEDLLAARFEIGARMWVSGMLQRRFRDSDNDTRRGSALDVVAHKTLVGAAAEDVLSL
jgi:single-stranded DNA-binding protein